jgi:hypothetical protein
MEHNHKYPKEVKYFCPIHRIEEIARFVGVMGEGANQFALYNTPQGHTIAHDKIFKLRDGTLEEEVIDKYREEVILERKESVYRVTVNKEIFYHTQKMKRGKTNGRR